MKPIYADGYRNGYKIPLSWLDLPEDHAWRVVPDPPEEDLLLPPPEEPQQEETAEGEGEGKDAPTDAA